MQGFLAWLTERTGEIAGALWSSPLTLGVLLLTGLYLTVRLRLVQVRGFRHALALLSGRYSSHRDVGEVSHFQALSTALSATVGTGNIAGVATAIAFGGPGALFWMWVTAAIGMATKFAECSLALRFREVSPDGEIAGGPMYTLARGAGRPWLARAFALFAMITAFGIGNMVQANSVVDGLRYVVPALEGQGGVVGLALAALVGLVIIGGVRRIARVASMLVPFMAVLYLAGAVIVVANHLPEVPAALATIVQHALSPWAVGGAAVGEAIRWGVARGLFSNEAGLGSSPMAHAAARTNEPVREGLVAMMEPFIDTLVICTMTGLAIVVTGAWQTPDESLKGAALTAHAFSLVLGPAGGWIVGLGLVLFAYSTTIAWSYYGDRAARFLLGPRAVMPYRVIYTLVVIVGAAVPLKLVWNLADIANLFMALPNLISLWLLAGVVARMERDYFSRPQRPVR